MITYIKNHIAKRKKMKSVESTIGALLGLGTAIVSFEYHGKVRNVTVGAHLDKAMEKRGISFQGKNKSNLVKVNRAIYKNRLTGRKMLRCLVQNDDSSAIKNFFLDEIKNLQHNRKIIS